MGAVVELEPRTVAVTPGDRATAVVRIRNSGSVVDQFSLEVLGDSSSWATVEPSSVSLFPGAEDSATVTFAPPRSSAIRAGVLPFGLRVESKEDPAGSLVDEGTLDVAPFTEVSAELVPRTSRGSTGATHDVAVDNRGNMPLNAALNALDPDRLLDFDVRPPALNADPGAAVFAKLRVRPKKTFWLGGAVSRPFQVQVDVPAGEPLTLDGSLLQTPILPRWTPRALMGVAALAVTAVVLWLAVLQPAIESTARDQANDVLAAVGITPPPSDGGDGNGASGSPSSSDGTSPSGEPTGSPSVTTAATAPGAGGATLSDGRLLAGGTAVSPPAGASLFLTDLVFSNPSDTLTGDIRLERAGEPLIVLRLENFRDIDFHFVTPIMVASGQELALVCPAPTGCPGASLYYSGFVR